MADFTDDLGFTLQEDNENPDSWGQVLNAGVIKLLEESQVGGAEKSVIDVTASQDITLVITNGVESDTLAAGTNKARCGILILEGTLANDIEITLPTKNNRYIVIGGNDFISGAFTATFKTTNSTNTVSMNSGDIAFFVTTGDELYPIIQTGGTTNQFLDKGLNLADLTNARDAIDNLGIYPPGAIYITTSNIDVNTFLPGTWQAAAEGRVLIGVGTGTDDALNNRTINAGETAGEYDHQLTEAELASHDHPQQERFWANFDATGGIGIYTLGINASTWSTDVAGGDQPHNNMMPYLGVYIWERIA